MSEQVVRALGAVLARALAAMHALGSVHGQVSAESVEITSAGPRLPANDAESRSAAGPPASTDLAQGVERSGGPADDVFDLATVLVFAATGGPVGTELPFGPGLAEVLRACLDEDESARPTAAEVARALEDPHWTGSWLPVSVGSHTGVTREGDRVPWIITAACWFVIVAVIVATIAVLARREHDAPRTVDPDGNTDACALIDLPALERLAGKTTGNPENKVLDNGPFRGRLCSAGFRHGYLSVLLNISADGRESVAAGYRVDKSTQRGTSGAGITFEHRSGLGEDAYVGVRKTGAGDFVSCRVGFIDGNMHMSINFSVNADPGAAREELAALCVGQARTAAGRLR
ncbi:hypothetical protein ACWEKT_28230 [Nocardia takedensis]